jgi:hypothetical protein
MSLILLGADCNLCNFAHLIVHEAPSIIVYQASSVMTVTLFPRGTAQPNMARAYGD